MTEEISKIEADLSQKHEEELRQLKSTNDTEVNVFIQPIDKSSGYALRFSILKHGCLIAAVLKFHIFLTVTVLFNRLGGTL